MKKQMQWTPAAMQALANGDIENFLTAALPGGIEQQEAMGQAAFVCTKSSLPRLCPKQQLELLGFRFHENIDDLFVAVTFPAGWSKQATDQAMWSKLIDDKGRERGAIFYKAALYDRRANMHDLKCRYGVQKDYPDDDGPVRVSVKDHDGTVLFDAGTASSRDWPEQQKLMATATTWLSENYPEWRNPLAYWDAAVTEESAQ